MADIEVQLTQEDGHRCLSALLKLMEWFALYGHTPVTPEQEKPCKEALDTAWRESVAAVVAIEEANDVRILGD